MHLLLLLSLVVNLAHAGEYKVGQRDLYREDPARKRILHITVWYPAKANSKLGHVESEKNLKASPFQPVLAARAAKPFKGKKFPLLLLSHGSGGKADKLFWFAEPLVQQGFIVVGVDHLHNMTGDNTADGMLRVWDRPKDLTFALDTVLGHKEFEGRVDTNRISAAGHSAGGTTVLLLAGARFSPEKFTSPIPNCGETKEPYYAEFCKKVRKYDLDTFKKEEISGDYSDARVKAIVALDPGFAKSFDPTSLQQLRAKSLVFLADKLNSPTDEIHAKDFLGLMPASAKVVPGAYHMTFLQACKPDYPKDDLEFRELCIENDQKIKIQNEVTTESIKFLTGLNHSS